MRIPIDEIKAGLWTPIAVAGKPALSRAGNSLMRKVRPHIIGQTWRVVIEKVRIDAEHFPHHLRRVRPG